jgi:serine/threonine-protein kinase RsbW
VPTCVPNLPSDFAQFVIPNRISALRQMSAWLEERVRTLGFPDSVVFKFDLCANEAVSNVILYGYPEPGDRQILLRLGCEGRVLELEIVDDGTPFNPLAYPRRVPATRLQDAEIGGFGIELIKGLMSECSYERTAGNNVFKMVYRPDELADSQ